MSDSNSCFLTCIQVSWETGKVVWYSHLFKNFPQFVVIPTVKVFTVVNEVDVFFWNSLAFSMIQRMLAIWSLIPLPFLNTASTSGSSQFMHCWSLVWRIFEHNFTSCEMMQLWSSLNILWHCPSLAFGWKLTFSSPVATASFSKFAGILSTAFPQHHPLGFEIAQLEFHHLN